MPVGGRATTMEARSKTREKSVNVSGIGLGRTSAVGLALAFVFAWAQAPSRAEEVPDRGPIPFAAFDQNGDGVISEDEFSRAHEERRARRAAEGRPLRGAGEAPAFADFDTNGDGKLTPEELAAGQKARAEKRAGAGMGRGRGAGPVHEPGSQRPAFEDFDLDGDGTIVEKELQEGRAARIAERAKQGYPMKNLGRAPSFDDLDADGDGGVSREEFAAHQAERRPSKPQP